MGPIFIEGRTVDPIDAVAEVLKHLQHDAAIPRENLAGYALDRAVITIPVDFGGTERRALRQAARKAGIEVIQFVHEPVAALYAYLRSQSDFRRELARLDGRSVLVFDWGGGTLDLTLCRIQGGSIMQVANFGDNEIGGDEFDNRLRNLVREKHATVNGLEDVLALEQPGMAAKLLNECEKIKIELSKPSYDSSFAFAKGYLRTDGAGQNLNVTVTRAELEHACANLITRGLSHIDDILERVNLTRQDIELCLATGGMVNMIAIRDGLNERFPGRVPRLSNGDSLIAQGAAWIANDGLRLTLSKPIELLVSDSTGRGKYHTLVPAGFTLPTDEVQEASNSKLFCVDPRDGVAVVELVKPMKVGAVTQRDPRETLCVVSVPIDRHAEPLIERLECDLQIDTDYVVTVIFTSSGARAETRAEFYDLDFGLALPWHGGEGGREPESGGESEPNEPISWIAAKNSNVAARTNIAIKGNDHTTHEELWRLVPGDIVAKWRSGHFEQRSSAASRRQHVEKDFYLPCTRCKRLISQIKAEGPVQQCRKRSCGFELPQAGIGPAETGAHLSA
jgi:actin-like ATPase involved in cell morphogenesis